MRSSRSTTAAALLVTGLPCVVVVAVHGELSPEALVAVTATGLVLTGLGLAARAGVAAPPVGRAALPWLLWLLVAVAWELLTLVHDALPTLSDVLDPVLAHPPARAAATVLWLAVGAWLLTRPSDRQGVR